MRRFAEKEALEETREQFVACGGAAEQLPLDVADRRQVEHGAREMLARLGRCDILADSAADLARVVRSIAEAPPHVCLNEVVVTPTWNRLLVGGEDIRLTPPRS